MQDLTPFELYCLSRSSGPLRTSGKLHSVPVENLISLPMDYLRKSVDSVPKLKLKLETIDPVPRITTDRSVRNTEHPSKGSKIARTPGQPEFRQKDLWMVVDFVSKTTRYYDVSRLPDFVQKQGPYEYSISGEKTLRSLFSADIPAVLNENSIDDDDLTLMQSHSARSIQLQCAQVTFSDPTLIPVNYRVVRVFHCYN